MKKYDAKNMKISDILKRSFRMVIILAVVLGVSSIFSIASLNSKASTLSQQGMTEVAFLKSVETMTEEYESIVYKAIAADDREISKELLASADEKLNSILSNIEQYGTDKQDEDVDGYVSTLAGQVEELKGYQEQLEKSLAAGNIAEQYSYVDTNMEPLLDKLKESQTALIGCVAQELAAKLKRMMFQGISAIVVNVLLLAGMTALSVLVAKKIRSLITEALTEVEAAMQSLAEGDFSAEITYQAENEFGGLADRIRDTIAKLQKYIRIEDEVLSEIANMNMNVQIEEDFVGDFKKMQISIEKIIDAMNEMFLKTRDSAAVIDSAAEQVSAVAGSLAENSSNQAASMEELVATIQQITENVTENANMAVQMSLTAKVVNEKVENGKVCMDELQDAMSAITQKSQGIANIIGVINDIADQTNLLALNASIEAARAGETGRGFGVVAAEIAKLANQCAEAVKDTKTMIDESIKAVDIGTKKVDESIALMQEIVSSNEESGRCIEEVSSVCEQQAAALEQTQAGTSQIAESVQEGSAMAEEASATSEELAAQVAELNTMLQKCQIKEIA